jgi:hypothetical protein
MARFALFADRPCMSAVTPISSPAVAAPLAAGSLVNAQVMASLKPGAVMPALVLGLIDDLTLRLQLPAGTLDVASNVALAPGTRLQLAVTGSAVQPKITLTPMPGTSLPAPTQTIAARTPVVSAPLSEPALAPAAQIARPARPNVPQLLQAIVGGIAREAVAKQDGLAPLMADLEAIMTRPAAPIPANMRAAAAQLLSLRLDASTPVDTAALKTALAQAGFAQAMPEGARAPDIASALSSLRDTLAAMGAGAQAKPMPVLRADRPAPPHRGAATAPQPATAPSLSADMEPADIATHLLARTDSALARQTLLQIASLPEAVTGEGAKPDIAGARLTFDIPVATALGTGVVQIRIEQDAKAARETPDMRPVWRVNFSIDLEPVGPVHASIALAGERAAVTLHAERDDSAKILREGLPLLEAGLKDAALEAGELICRSGAPAAPRAAPGLFVDQAS